MIGSTGKLASSSDLDRSLTFSDVAGVDEAKSQVQVHLMNHSEAPHVDEVLVLTTNYVFISTRGFQTCEATVARVGVEKGVGSDVGRGRGGGSNMLLSTLYIQRTKQLGQGWGYGTRLTVVRVRCVLVRTCNARRLVERLCADTPRAGISPSKNGCTRKTKGDYTT